MRKVFRRNLRSGKPETFASIWRRRWADHLPRFYSRTRGSCGGSARRTGDHPGRRRVSSRPCRNDRKVLSALPVCGGPAAAVHVSPAGFWADRRSVRSRRAGRGHRNSDGCHRPERRVGKNGAHIVHYEEGGILHALQADHVWSTIPITTLTRCVQPAVPAECLCKQRNVSNIGE